MTAHRNTGTQRVAAELKDEKYWSLRRKNNLAAKRSRDNRRLKDMKISMKAEALDKQVVSRSFKQKLIENFWSCIMNGGRKQRTFKQEKAITWDWLANGLKPIRGCRFFLLKKCLLQNQFIYFSGYDWFEKEALM